MADSVVTFLLQNLTQLLVDEAKLLSGVEDKVQSLRDELKMINIFLKSSEGKRNEHDIVKEVVSQIRDVSHQAEDVIDTYIGYVIKQRRRNILKKLYHSIGHSMMLHDVPGKIEKIKGKIEEIYKNKDKYNIVRGESTNGDDIEASESLRKRRRDVEEEEVVGFVHDSSEVISKLINSGSRRNVVSIIGMGGLGKTTLARKIYNNDQVKKLFPYRAWGFVSNDYRARELLLSLLHCFLSTSEYRDLFKKNEKRVTKKKKKTREGDLKKKKEDEDEVENEDDYGYEDEDDYDYEDEDDKTDPLGKNQDPLSEEQLKKKVRGCLDGKKYLVVLDDVWKTEVWDEVQDAFPDDRCSGSRILITSRIKEVASYTSQIPPYNLPFLNKEESWELLSKKLFKGQEFPPDLEPIGKMIAENCDGLPLAILVIAGLLVNKKSQREWSEIKNHLNWYLGQDKSKVNDILKLSYENLPRKLKPCFLYLGIYPEDYNIPVRQLIRLWIAEGFIQDVGTRNLEDVAEDYLDELVDRSLVQVASRRTDGGIKTCRIHDLLRDLCISESKDDKFLEVQAKTDIQTQSNPRRLSLHCETKFYMLSSTACDHSGTRSIFCFGQESIQVDSREWKWFPKNFTLARVLDLGRAELIGTIKDLDKFIHLRYIRIESKGKSIPASISSLWNLETLDVKGCAWKFAFPSGMWNLQRLRHLLMFGPVKLPKFPRSGVQSIMWNLQILSTVAIDPQTESLVKDGVFPNLKKLGLCYDPWDQNRKPLKQLECLHRLSNLHTLKIVGTSELPSANALPSNVTKITLTQFEFFSSNCLNALAKLINLQVLKLTGGGSRRSHKFDLDFAAEEFPQLQVFQMVEMDIERWILQKGAMPRLRRLVVKGCAFLTKLPEELWCLTTLREVQVLSPSFELVNMLQNLKVKNGCKLIVSYSD